MNVESWKFPYLFLSPRSSPSEAGVALIVTVIMISVITFLTVAFLALSGREKNSVKIATAQTAARLAADEASARAQTEMLAAIMNAGNIANFDLLVSTNYVNWNGFDPALGVVDQTTNVNYDYRNDPGQTPLTLPQSRQNMANLLYSPRPPVYVVTNLLTGASEFRFYIDLNRNRRHERSGYWPVTNLTGGYFDANGVPTGVYSTSNLFSYITGDPEWLGGLNRPQQPHSSSNKFLYRYAYLVVPEGKTLDINYIHNAARAAASGRMNVNGQHYFRNQGVGTWEINLAAFLYDLNTNSTYGWGLGNSGYLYDPLAATPVVGGNAFADAYGIYRYQLNGPLVGAVADPTYGLQAFGVTYGNAAATLFQNDQVDGYADGPIQVANNYAPEVPVVNRDDTKTPWVGANHPFHFFTTQDMFDPAKANRGGNGMKFTDRLYSASTNVSTYDQGTFYRLLSQLGTDSATEDDDKLNLNYVNVGGLKVTNFVKWTDPDILAGNPARNIPAYGVPGSVLFFTNAVDRLLRAYTTDWLAADFQNYTNTFKTDKVFGMGDIPVYVNTQMVYSVVTHRILQLVANIWDAKTNRVYASGSTNIYPTVFRPIFTKSNENVYISSFVEEASAATLASAIPNNRPILDLYITNNAAIPSDGNVLIYGVPLVIGAKKYQPNFNEFSFESTFQLTRKVQLYKSGIGGADKINKTNQYFTLSFNMPCAAEFWNAYATDYGRSVDIFITNQVTMVLTNGYPPLTPAGVGVLGMTYRTNFTAGGFRRITQTGTNVWSAFRENFNNKSFVVPLNTNVIFLPDVVYRPSGNQFFPTSLADPYDPSDPNLLAPNWGVVVTNRIHAMVIDLVTRKIIDYVLLGDLTSYRNLSAEFSVANSGTGDPFDLLWVTNRIGSQVSGRKGVEHQIDVSRGGDAGVNVTDNRWKSYGTLSPNNVVSAINGFNKFLSPESTELQHPVPFSPSIKFAMPMSWQANDPMVHYLSSELFYIDESGQLKDLMKNPTAEAPLSNIGSRNKRYKPWAKTPDALDTDPDAFNFSIKDPLVRSSDDWNFPTNNFATVGWLGQIHRGTPWQTIYLKSSNVGLTNIVNSPTEWANNIVYKPSAEKWANWTGNKTWAEGYYSRPVSDRVLFDVFSAALNENSTRGQLPINQTNLAAWSAVFSGMIALTNSSSEGALLAGLPGQFSPIVIQPAGLYNAFDSTTWSPLVRLVDGINRTRANTNYFANSTFNHMGDILAVPELTDASPFLNLAPGSLAVQRGINDAAYEWLPQQAMSLLQLGKPRFVIYAYGQSLQPAPNSIVTAGGAFFGLCTNYAITAEVATRTVVEIKGTAKAPRVEVKSYNILGPD